MRSFSGTDLLATAPEEGFLLKGSKEREKNLPGMLFGGKDEGESGDRDRARSNQKDSNHFMLAGKTEKGTPPQAIPSGRAQGETPPQATPSLGEKPQTTPTQGNIPPTPSQGKTPPCAGISVRQRAQLFGGTKK